MNRYITLVLGLSIVGAACAKRRSTEPAPVPVQDRLEKSALLSNPVWKGQATIVKNSPQTDESAFPVGLSSSINFGYFEFTREQLIWRNYYTVNDLGIKSEIPEYIASWPIEHSEYRLAETDGKVSNVEQENPNLSWDTKSHFVVDWSAFDSLANVGDFADAACWETKTKRVVPGSQEYSKEHFTFVVEYNVELKDVIGCIGVGDFNRRMNNRNLTTSYQVRFSFAPYEAENKGYVPFSYKDDFDPDIMKYGFITQTHDGFDRLAGEYRKRILAQRYDPNKTHKIYLSPDFPVQYKWIVTHPEMGIIARTNKVFADHGLKIRFEAVDDGSYIGDVRKSFISFATGYAGNLLGFNQRFSNPMTGETLRSNSVFYPVGLENMVRNLKDTIANDIDLIDQGKSTIFRSLNQILNQKQLQLSRSTNTQDIIKDWLTTAEPFRAESEFETQKAFHEILAKYTYAAAPMNEIRFDQGNALGNTTSPLNSLLSKMDNGDGVEFLNSKQREILQTIDPMNASRNNKLFSQMEAAVEGMKKQAGNHRQLDRFLTNRDCKYEFDASAISHVGNSIQFKSVQEVIDGILYTTAIHELGHGLGLEHNFYGSIDYHHFDKRENLQLDREGKPLKDRDGNELKAVESTSSIMDYVPSIVEVNSARDWKPYDAAALVYLYSTREIDLSEKKLVKPATANQTPEFATIENKKPFMYCTNAHVGDNPLCNMHDIGVSPSEIVWNEIRSYIASYKLTHERRADVPYWSPSPMATVGSLYRPLKMLSFYSKLVDGGWQFSFDPKSRLTPETTTRIREAIVKDSTRAASLLAAYYFAVTQLSSTETPIEDIYDPGSGSLKNLGNFYDKMYSVLFLGQEWGFTLDTNTYDVPVSFVDFTNKDDELGKLMGGLAESLVVGDVELRTGLETFNRGIFLATASNQTNFNTRVLDKMRIGCYTEGALKQRFEFDVDAWFPVFKDYYLTSPDAATCTNSAGNPTVCTTSMTDLALINLDPGMSVANVGTNTYPVREPMFKNSGKQGLAIMKYLDRYFVAGEYDNPYAFELIKSWGSDAAENRAAMRYVVGIWESVSKVSGWNKQCTDVVPHLPQP